MKHAIVSLVITNVISILKDSRLPIVWTGPGEGLWAFWILDPGPSRGQFGTYFMMPYMPSSSHQAKMERWGFHPRWIFQYTIHRDVMNSWLEEHAKPRKWRHRIVLKPENWYVSYIILDVTFWPDPEKGGDPTCKINTVLTVFNTKMLSFLFFIAHWFIWFARFFTHFFFFMGKS